MYVYVVVMNTGQTAYIPTAGSIDLGWYSANHFDGSLLGVYYKGAFYPAVLFGGAPNAPSITSSTSYYAIYKMNYMKLDNPPSSNQQHGVASVQSCSGVTRQSRMGPEAIPAMPKTKITFPAQSFFPDYGSDTKLDIFMVTSCA